MIVSRYTKGRKDSYQTSQCKCSAVHLMLLLSQVHWTPWLFSRCQKTRDIFSITQTISIIMQVGDVCASWWSLSLVILQGSKEKESYQTRVQTPLKHHFPTQKANCFHQLYLSTGEISTSMMAKCLLSYPLSCMML